MPLVEINVSVDGVDELLARLTPAEQISAVRSVVHKYARVAQREATQNVSNRSVSFQGNSFVIKRQTGNLARSIQIVSETALTATIIATGGGDRKHDYAAYVEMGHREFDMKPFLIGKTVPLPGGKAAWSAKAFGATGIVKVPKVATTGRSMGSKIIVFRRVGPNSTGWIIPAMPPRPFMAAAAATIAKPFAEAIGEAIKAQIQNTPPPADPTPT